MKRLSSILGTGPGTGRSEDGKENRLAYGKALLEGEPNPLKEIPYEGACKTCNGTGWLKHRKRPAGTLRTMAVREQGEAVRDTEGCEIWVCPECAWEEGQYSDPVARHYRGEAARRMDTLAMLALLEEG
jgi:hypothetical protein